MKKDYYFTTKDLLFIAGFSAIGGLASTYINFIGDLFQSFLGFSGTTQWAAGLHILWILLAVGIINKPGTAVLIGILKGLVEFLSGNTHGVLVLIINLVAGLIVELIFFLPLVGTFLKNLLAGGLSAMSNVFVFQIFASIPANSIAYWSLFFVAAIALLSGIIFGGFVSQSILNSLNKTGVISLQKEIKKPKWQKNASIVFGIGLLAVFVVIYLQSGLSFREISLTGNVVNPQTISAEEIKSSEITVEITSQGKTASYNGFPLRNVLKIAKPDKNSDLILITATDGYSYFITMKEVEDNADLILVIDDEESNVNFSIVGAENSKAWVRNVMEIAVIESPPVPIIANGEQISVFFPQYYQYEMDSARFEINGNTKKLQGVALSTIINEQLSKSDWQLLIIESNSSQSSFDIETLKNDDSFRIFINIEGYQMRYFVGTLQGEILLQDITRIEMN